jgi:hypothetical protein
MCVCVCVCVCKNRRYFDFFNSILVTGIAITILVMGVLPITNNDLCLLPTTLFNVVFIKMQKQKIRVLQNNTPKDLMVRLDWNGSDKMLKRAGFVPLPEIIFFQRLLLKRTREQKSNR